MSPKGAPTLAPIAIAWFDEENVSAAEEDDVAAGKVEDAVDVDALVENVVGGCVVDVEDEEAAAIANEICKKDEECHLGTG